MYTIKGLNTFVESWVRIQTKYTPEQLGEMIVKLGEMDNASIILSAGNRLVEKFDNDKCVKLLNMVNLEDWSRYIKANAKEAFSDPNRPHVLYLLNIKKYMAFKEPDDCVTIVQALRKWNIDAKLFEVRMPNTPCTLRFFCTFPDEEKKNNFIDILREFASANSLTFTLIYDKVQCKHEVLFEKTVINKDTYNNFLNGFIEFIDERHQSLAEKIYLKSCEAISPDRTLGYDYFSLLVHAIREVPTPSNEILAVYQEIFKTLFRQEKIVFNMYGNIYNGNIYNGNGNININNGSVITNTPQINPYEIWLRHLISVGKAPDWYDHKIKRSKVYDEYNKFVSTHNMDDAKIDTKPSKTKFMSYMNNKLIIRLDDKTQMDREMIFNMIPYKDIRV